jgi:hypothetical protein
MRRLALIAGLIAALATAPPADAKRLHSLAACGRTACSTTDDRVALAAFTDVGPPADRPAHPGPFYRLTVRVGGSGRPGTSWWAPGAGRLLGEDGTWMAVRPAVTRALARLTAGLTPRPAAQLPGFPEVRASPGDRSAPATVWIAALAAVAVVAAVALALLARAAQAATRTGAAGAGRANR